jgi:hypothetical protein
MNPANPNDRRAAYYLWLERAPNSDCKAEYGWYQFLKPYARVIGANGVGPDVTQELARFGQIASKTEAKEIFGQWTGDTYKKYEDELRAKKQPVPPHQKMNLPGSREPVEAGEYVPTAIPGTNGTQGMMDAPNSGNTGAYQELVSRLQRVGRIPYTDKSDTQPQDISFTLVITTTLQTYLFKLKPDPSTCLGYSTQNYTETMKIRLTWTESTKRTVGFQSEKVWNADPRNAVVDRDDSTVTFGPWQACPAMTNPKKKE